VNAINCRKDSWCAAKIHVIPSFYPSIYLHFVVITLGYRKA